jgi:hypothetical protein
MGAADQSAQGVASGDGATRGTARNHIFHHRIHHVGILRVNGARRCSDKVVLLERIKVYWLAIAGHRTGTAITGQRRMRALDNGAVIGLYAFDEVGTDEETAVRKGRIARND